MTAAPGTGRGPLLPAWFAAVTLVLPSTGCVAPADRADATAAAAGLTRRVVEGTDFRHVVYRNDASAAGRGLHVYIDGDGTPWLDRWTVSPDPTPRRPLMLQLMLLDPGAAAYVARPCYSGLARDPPCTPLEWTHDRYGQRVVDSLARVVATLVADSGAQYVELYGHSGGGTLAVLLARQVPDVRRVVTLAGNLDPDAWADLHGYARLAGSGNPVRLGPLPGAVEQRHYAGALDTVVPAAMVAEAARQLGSAADVEVLPGVTHLDGWEAAWPGILAGQAPRGASGEAQRNE